MVTSTRPRRAAAGGMLAVWANGSLVGRWELTAGEHRLSYATNWIASPQGRQLSLSLPFTPGNQPHRGDQVRNYFDNLLPDSDAIRRRMQEKFVARSADTFDLLAAVGRDCVGAIQLLPEGVEPEGWNRIAAQALDE
ncbi:MAG: HipA N-terminal domain-containing protein, partial [Pseudomonadota bacterium]